MEKLSVIRQLFNLIKIRERKEGQIRSLKWAEKVMKNHIERIGEEPTLMWGLHTIQNQMNREFRELDTIKEDIKELSQGNDADYQVALSISQA